LSYRQDARSRLYVPEHLPRRERQRGFIGIVNPYRGTFPGVLDGLTANLFAGFSVLKLSISATNCLRVRRSSDNAEQTIGFAGQYLDTASMLAFVGANDGFVVTWFDQSGLGNDLTQATTTKQPQIVYAGTYYGWMLFDGVDDYLGSSALTSASITGITVHIAGRSRGWPQVNPVGSSPRYLYYLEDATKKAFASLAYNTGTTTANWSCNVIRTGQNVGEAYFFEFFTNNEVLTAVHNLAAGTLALQSLEDVNAVAVATATTAGAIGSGNFPTVAINVGGSVTGAQFSELAAQTFLWYETAQSGGTISSIAAAIPAYNGTPTTANNLDNYLTSISGLYALVKQRSAYAGSCLRVRRSSDNTEQDVGFTAAGVIDTASMLTFVGANNGFVTKWYDQSAAANDLIQATTANQPQIVSSGAYLGWIQFDGSNDILSQTSNSGTPAAFTAYAKAVNRSVGSSGTVYDFCNHGNTSSPDCTMTYQFNSSGIVFATITAGPNNSVSNYLTQFAGNVLTCNFVRGAASFALACQTYNGGKLMTANSRNDSGFHPDRDICCCEVEHRRTSRRNASGACQLLRPSAVRSEPRRSDR
jgi:hypothetical protein